MKKIQLGRSALLLICFALLIPAAFFAAARSMNVISTGIPAGIQVNQFTSPGGGMTHPDPPPTSTVTMTTTSTSTVISTMSTTLTSTSTSIITERADGIALSEPCQWKCNANEYDWLILNISSWYGIPDTMLIKAQIMVESGFDTYASTWNNACQSNDNGLLQIDARCNNLNATELFYPFYQLDHGLALWMRYFNSLSSEWGSACSLKTVVMGTLEIWNKGINSVGSYCGSFPQGTQYADTVFTFYYEFCADANYSPKM